MLYCKELIDNNRIYYRPSLPKDRYCLFKQDQFTVTKLLYTIRYRLNIRRMFVKKTVRSQQPEICLSSSIVLEYTVYCTLISDLSCNFCETTPPLVTQDFLHPEKHLRTYAWTVDWRLASVRNCIYVVLSYGASILMFNPGEER